MRSTILGLVMMILGALAGAAKAGPEDLLAGKFQWQAGPPLVAATGEGVISFKDPTVVFDAARWHIYATIKRTGREACMEYLSFTDWAQAGAAPRHRIELSDTYHCAPQVFYFRPHKKWYLVYQYTDKSKGTPYFGPACSTLEDAGKPETISRPEMLFPAKPDNLKGWLDFWVICDETNAHLFFSSLDGRFWHSRAPIGEFPHGWSRPEVAIQGDIFEASHTYRLKGLNQFMTLIEAQGPKQTRYYKAYLADQLDGPWRELAATREKAFASQNNVSFAPGVEAWTDSISHGELLRDGNDETLTVDPAHLRFLFQGVSAKDREGKGYGQFPWRLGLLEAAR